MCVKESSATSVGSARVKVRRYDTHSKAVPRGAVVRGGQDDSLAWCGKDVDVDQKSDGGLRLSSLFSR